MSHVAILTFGVLQEEYEHPQIREFIERADPVFAAAAHMPGFVQLVEGKDLKDDPLSSLVVAEQCERVAQTLSVWTQLESVFAFAYYRLHAEALAKRKAWFLKPAWPTYVLWWVADTHIPDWREAYQQHVYLHTHGSTAQAFDFKTPFDVTGQPTQIDKDKVKSLAPFFTA